MSASLEAYLRNSSGWNIRKVIHLKIHTVRYMPLAGSSYIELPATLRKSNSILNMKNMEDDKCFLWSILASLHPTDTSPESLEHYKAFEGEINMEGIDYPVSLAKLSKFERQNPNVSLNVFTFEENHIVPLKISKNEGRLNHVDLLFLKDEKTSYFCLIKNFNRFFI